MSHSAPVGFGDVRPQEIEQWVEAIRELAGEDASRFDGVAIEALREHCETVRDRETIARHLRRDERVVVKAVPQGVGRPRLRCWPKEGKR